MVEVPASSVVNSTNTLSPTTSKIRTDEDEPPLSHPPSAQIPSNKSASISNSSSNCLNPSSNNGLTVKTVQIPPLPSPPSAPSILVSSSNDTMKTNDELVGMTPSGTPSSIISSGTNNTNGNGNNRIKAPPICRIPSLRKEHMTSEQMSKWCFAQQDVWSTPYSGSSSSSSSSTNGNFSEVLSSIPSKESRVGSSNDTMESKTQGNDHTSTSFTTASTSTAPSSTAQKKRTTSTVTTTSVSSSDSSVTSSRPMSPQEWQVYKKNILTQNESRNGRETQRFGTDKKTGQILRLTTGCVPIMNDGKILLVSSSRKGEWILPKGGWESDETIEVSALREAYEEGGVLGVIGPRLNVVEFETRKAKKRRMELESLKKKTLPFDSQKAIQQLQHHQQLQINTPSTLSIQSNASSTQEQSEDDQLHQTHSTIGTTTEATHNNSNKQSKMLVPPSPSSQNNIHTNNTNNNNNECLATQIRKILTSNNKPEKNNDDSASIASSEVSSTPCSHVRLSMFPLYVLEVREHWPESGRARKVVDIDTAIETMASRPEFHKVLLEVKEKGYHLRPHQNQEVGSQHEKDNKDSFGVKDI